MVDPALRQHLALGERESERSHQMRPLTLFRAPKGALEELGDRPSAVGGRQWRFGLLGYRTSQPVRVGKRPGSPTK